MTLFFLLLCLPTLALASDHWYFPRFLWRRSERTVPAEGYYNPLSNNGVLLTKIPVTYPMGQGEPLNIIISGNSHAEVLVDSELNGGLRNYFLSIGFSGECLGQHAGSNQGADLGDGNGFKNQTDVMRWNYGDPELGACKESVQGGNHFRFWIQDGPSGNSGAVFLAASYEKPIAQGHDIIINGYNLGRDWLIGNITKSGIPTRQLTNSSTYSGTTTFGGYSYRSDIKFVSGLLPNTSDSINHNITVGVGMNAVDGLVAVFDVFILERPPASSARSLTITPRQFQAAFAGAVLLHLLTLVA